MSLFKRGRAKTPSNVIEIPDNREVTFTRPESDDRTAWEIIGLDNREVLDLLVTEGTSEPAERLVAMDDAVATLESTVPDQNIRAWFYARNRNIVQPRHAEEVYFSKEGWGAGLPIRPIDALLLVGGPDAIRAAAAESVQRHSSAVQLAEAS